MTGSVVGPGYELVGFTLDGPPPLGRIHFPLHAGLSVLYGLNGVGKTRMLRAMAAAVTGVSLGEDCDAVLHLRVSDPVMPLGGPFLGELVKTVRDEIMTNRDRPEPEDWFKPAEKGGETAWTDLLNLANDGDADYAIAETGFLSCYASGTPDRPSWTVFVSAPDLELHKAAAHLKIGDTDLAQPASTYRLHVDDRARARRVLRLLKAAQANPTEESVGALFDETGRGYEIAWRGPRLRALLNGSDPDVDAHWEAAHVWPDWLPLPVYELATVQQPPARLWTDVTSSLDLARAALDAALGQTSDAERRVLSIASETELEVDERFKEEANALVQRACRLLALALPSRLQVDLDLRHPEDWLMGRPPRWWARDAMTGNWVDLEELSAAERRWASLCIDLAIQAHQQESALPLLVMVDEPESGLHRQAESHLGDALAKLGREVGGAVIVATHSPALLGAREAELHFVHRVPTSGLTGATPLNVELRPQLRSVAEDLGVAVADLLQLLRVALVVEGAHDEVVLQHLLGPAMAESGCWVLPMRGAKNAAGIPDAQILFEATPARVLVVLDNLDQATVSEAWAKLCTAHVRGDRRAVKTQLERLTDGRGGEGRWLSAMARRAMEVDRLDRIEPFGLSEPDVVMYLPVTDFVPDASSWNSLYDQYRRDQSSVRPRSAVDFKAWLNSRHRATISKRTIEHSVRRLTVVPEEIKQLGLRLSEAAWQV